MGNKLSGEQRVKVKAASINCVCVDNRGTIGLYTVASIMVHSAEENCDFHNIREWYVRVLCLTKTESEINKCSVNRDSRFKLSNKPCVTA